MPPRERFRPDDSREWLNRARSNLAKAKTRIVDVYWEDLCFDAQQAAEKVIKSVLIHHGVEFPYVHDLNRLLALLERAARRFRTPFVELRISPDTPRLPAILEFPSRFPRRSTGKPSRVPRRWSTGQRSGCGEVRRKADSFRRRRSKGGLVDSGVSFDDRPWDIACHESVDDLHPAAQLASWRHPGALHALMSP